MKVFLMMVFCIFSLNVHAGDFLEEKTLTLSVAGIDKFEIDCGEGRLKITGGHTAGQIEVVASLYADRLRKDAAEEFVRRNVELKLEKRGSKAILLSKVDRSFWKSGGVYIHLDIVVPDNLDIEIDDGSGEINIANLKGNLEIDDGSGGVFLTDIAGNIRIDDGSGSLEISRVQGDLHVTDGSGDLTIREIKGNVRVGDGSGSIRIDGVSEDVYISGAGSGGLNIENVRGTVTKRD